MEVKFEIGDELKGVLDKNDLEKIEKEVNHKKEFILQLKEEFLKIPEEFRHYFTAELDVWNRIINEKCYMARVFIMTPLVGGISVVYSEIDRPNRNNFLIGKVKI